MKPFFRIRLLKRYRSRQYTHSRCRKAIDSSPNFFLYVVINFQNNNLPNADNRFDHFHPLCTPSIGFPLYASLSKTHGLFTLW